MKKFYDAFCRFEVIVTSLLLVTITILVLASALARTVGHPINWGVDISMLLFAWSVFLGGDIAVRTTDLICIDMLVKKLPKQIDKAIVIFFYVLMIAFLALLVVYGTQLCLDTKKRLFQVLPLSYVWCTACVPIGSFLMIISASIRLSEVIKMPLERWRQT